MFADAALKSNSKHLLITRKRYAFSSDSAWADHRATFAVGGDRAPPLAALVIRLRTRS